MPRHVSTGCFNSTTLIKVKPDGSGTVEQTLTMNTEMLKQLAGMMGAMTSGSGADGKATAKGPTSPDDLLTEDEARKMAERMGPGVRFVSRTPLKDATGEGARVIFSFEDINKVAVQEATSPSATSAKTREEPVRFKMVRGGGASTLTVTFPDKPGEMAGAASGREKPERPTPEQLAMVQQFFKGMHIEVGVDVDGTLVKTSSPYVQGNRVTLLEINFDDLFANPAAFEEFGDSLGPGMSMSEARAKLKDVKGVKINEPVVTIEMR